MTTPEEESYEDIIRLPHHVSATRRRMPPQARAAQFAPFAALSGFGDSIEETARTTSPRMELSPEEAMRLSRRLRGIMAAERHPRVRIRYFSADRRKAGGGYVDFTAAIKGIDDSTRSLLFTDGTSVPLDDILSLRPER